MKRVLQSDELLRDVLAADVTDPGFRARVIEEMLAAADRRSARRKLARACGAGVAVLVVAGLLWYAGSPPYRNTPGVGHVVVVTAEQPPVPIVHTVPFVPAVRPAPVSVAIVSTKPDGLLRLISDSELLAYFRRTPAALVKTGPHEQRLILPDGEAEPN